MRSREDGRGGDCVRGKSSILAWFWRLADWVWRRVRPTDRPSSTGGDPPPWQNGPLTNQSFFFFPSTVFFPRPHRERPSRFGRRGFVPSRWGVKKLRQGSLTTRETPDSKRRFLHQMMDGMQVQLGYCIFDSLANIYLFYPSQRAVLASKPLQNSTYS